MNDELLFLLHNDRLSESGKKNLEDYVISLEQRVEELQQENERLIDDVDRYKQIIEGNENCIKALRKEYNDYKSRCEKASECIKKDTRWFDSEYVRVYGELCDCAGAKGDRLEVMVNPSNALNILQNGSDSQ